MKKHWIPVILCAVLLAAPGCGNKPAAAGGEAPADEAAKNAPTPQAAAVQDAKPAPYTYPPPVKGHISEVNTGTFDLVDGVAYPAKDGSGTVVYVVAEPIASPVLAGSPCPMTQARALTALRNAGWAEVTLDGSGKSPYFAKGTPYGGTSRETDTGGGRYWSSQLATAGGTATGSFKHKDHGGFDFALPVSSPKVKEASESDRSQQKYGDPNGKTPSVEQVTAAYQAVRAAAVKKDLKALLEAQGFDAKQVEAIRGLEGIDADFDAYSDRFLEPGETGEFQNDPGWGAIVGTGANSKGEKFLNFYWFSPCEDRLVLVAISENPQ